MGTFTDGGTVVTDTFLQLWIRFVDIIPTIVIAVIVFTVGLFIADFFGRLVGRVLQQMFLDQAVEKTGLKKTLERIGFKLSVSRALGLLVTWFLYAVVLIATAELLSLTQISVFLQSVVLYIPNVIIAVVILLVGILISNFVFTLVKETSQAAQLTSAELLANVAKWAILVFTIMATLVQLRVATELIQILFTGIVLMFSLAGGLAFGLGGKDRAKETIDRVFRK